MINIAIGITEPEPDRSFMLLVQGFLQAGRETIGEMSSTKKDIEISFLTDNNIKGFVRKLKARSNSKEPILPGEYQDSFEPNYRKQGDNPLQFIEEARYNGLIILDLSKIYKSIGLIKSLCKLLENCGYAILLLNPKHEKFNHIILKYDGSGASIFSIQAFSKLFPSEAKKANSATLISPLAFTRSQVAIEKQTIKRASEYYGALGFIKLPLNTFSDLFNYSLKNKADLLILTKPDLMEMLNVITKKEYSNLFKRNNLSVFVGIK
ncbi:MAG: hypothetical protein WD426_20105 [Anditalea sp.]